MSAPVAAAHLSAEPNYLPVGGKQRVVLTVHNDRDDEMTGFRLIAPDGLRVIGTGGGSGWNEFVEDDGTATFDGGRLAADTPVDFEVDLEATAPEPGSVELVGEQLYADGEAVAWDVGITLVPPGSGAPTEEGVGAGAIAAVLTAALLVLAGIALLLRRRLREPLQEG